MHKISIDASPSQIRKLRKGLKVRVKKGTGFNIIVHPHTYNRVSRAFGKNKGLELELSQEELQHNENYEEGDDMRGLFEEPQSGASMIPSPTEPSKLQEPVSRGTEGQGLFRKAKRSVKDHVQRSKLADSLNDHLKTNYDYLGRAGIDNAIKMGKQASMSRMGINARKALSAHLDGNDSDDNEHAPPSRMYIKGGSLTERGTIGLNGGMIHTFVPPALISQPFSANFQMQHFMPPQYQHYEQGGHDDSEDNGIGSGLYAGRGLGLGICGGKINRLQKAQMWTGYAGDTARSGLDIAKYGKDMFGNGLKSDAIGYAEDKAMDHLFGRKLNLQSDAMKFAKGKSKKYLGRGMSSGEMSRRRRPVPGQMYTM